MPVSLRVPPEKVDLIRKAAAKARQQGPLCQQRPSVNRRKRRIGRKNVGLQREPWGSVLNRGHRVFKPETTTVLILLR